MFNRRFSSQASRSSAAPVEHGFAAAAFLAPLLISLPLLDTDLTAGLPAECALGIPSLGNLRFPGYPVYLLAAKIFTLVFPWGSLLFRAHAFSLVCGALMSWLLFLAGRKAQFPLGVSLLGAWTAFLASWVWDSSRLAGPSAFHACLLAAEVVLTLDLIRAPARSRAKKITLQVWAALAGVLLGQQPDLIFWIAAFGLVGLRSGFLRNLGWKEWMRLGMGFGGGTLLPFLYFPWRLASGAFLNPDAFFAGGVPSPGHSLPSVLGQLQHYFIFSGRAFFQPWVQGPRWSRAWESLAAWWQTLPLLAFAVIFLGLFFNLRQKFLHAPGKIKDDAVLETRKTLAFLPLLSGLCILCVWPQPFQAVRLTFSLAAAFWGFRGLEYLYYEVGRQREFRPGVDRPLWPAILVMLLVPLLAFWKNHTPRRVEKNPGSTLSQTAGFMQALPHAALVLYSPAETAWAAVYLQQSRHLRTDLLLLPLTSPWPGPEAPGPKPDWSLSSQERIAARFQGPWLERLDRELESGRPVYLATDPRAPGLLLPMLRNRVTLQPSSFAWAEWENPRTRRRPVVYRLEPSLPITVPGK